MALRNTLASSLLFIAFSASLAAASGAQTESKPSQTAPDAPTCTDLSGKHSLPCPGAKAEAAGALPLSADTNNPASAGNEPIRVFSPSRRQKDNAGSASQPPTVVPASASTTAPVATPVALPNTRLATTTATEPVARVPRQRSIEWSLPANLLRDQKNIWTSPLHVRFSHVQWLAPLLGGTAILIASDRSIERKLPTSTSFIKNSGRASNYGAAAFAGLTGGAYLWSRLTGNEHMREATVLSGEAAANTFALTYVMKTITQRDRPQEGDGTGRFWSKGNSFPSEHAAAAWSIASVIAHEYPSPLMSLLAYGGAAGISAARVTGRKHFASDALVGSALGWFIGREVYRAHHEGTDTAAYGTFGPAPRAEGPSDPSNMASTYVPLDSWVYPAMDRLSALGYLSSSFAGLRPWTRMECARLVDEAALDLQSEADGGNNEAARLLRTLQTEFAFETDRLAGTSNYGAQLESIYTRVTGISGQPLTDGFHFGQTIINDYGRPYQEGTNFVGGVSGRAVAGPFSVYVRGEYQHAPLAPALPQSARDMIFRFDSPVPIPPATPVAEVNRFRLVEGYVAIQVSNWQLSFGKQSQSWGPGRGGALIFSNNAEPIPMLRLDRVTPLRLPSIFGLLGPVRTQYFFGQLEGHHFIGVGTGVIGSYDQTLSRPPYISGEKFSFKPTPNLEVSVSYTSIFSGGNVPLTAHTFIKGMFSTGNSLSGTASDPGDRRSGVDWSYRLPGLRNWVTFYGDAFTEDEFSPVAYWDRSAIRAGLYLPQLPKIPKMDFRVEGVYTDLPPGGNLGSGFFYSNGRYRNGYTNNGTLLGSWIGRDGQGAQAWTSYHFTPRSWVEVGYRHQKVSQQFVGGGTLNDVSATADLLLRPDLSLRSLIQYERWTFPALFPFSQGNVTASFQLTYHNLKLGASSR